LSKKDSIHFSYKGIADLDRALRDGDAVLEIVREISWSRLVIDSGTRTGLIVIPNAST
jgi:hypothetical protein